HCVSCKSAIHQRLNKYCADHPDEPGSSEMNVYFLNEASKQTMDTIRSFEIWYELTDEFLTENNY
ncbi:hypothetical protein LCGC14_1858840, partial [marine sediment metagenome]